MPVKQIHPAGRQLAVGVDQLLGLLDHLVVVGLVDHLDVLQGRQEVALDSAPPALRLLPACLLLSQRDVVGRHQVLPVSGRLSGQLVAGVLVAEVEPGRTGAGHGQQDGENYPGEHFHF
ncbi:hypothetical protein D3C75_1043230 [compost metagenome]